MESEPEDPWKGLTSGHFIVFGKSVVAAGWGFVVGQEDSPE